jgi:cobalt-zinc-cadmium resistance protein CzcA
LPKGVVIEPFLDRTKMVNNAIGTVEKNLLEGALIVVFVLVVFLGNLRAGLIVASVIPLAMLFAIIMMNVVWSKWKFNEPRCARFWIDCRWRSDYS